LGSPRILWCAHCMRCCRCDNEELRPAAGEISQPPIKQKGRRLLHLLHHVSHVLLERLNHLQGACLQNSVCVREISDTNTKSCISRLQTQAADPCF
jgi:hypothetical protein